LEEFAAKVDLDWEVAVVQSPLEFAVAFDNHQPGFVPVGSLPQLDNGFDP